MRPNFTLNYGLRYDHETAFKEATGVEDASLNLAPRFGFAWDPKQRSEDRRPRRRRPVLQQGVPQHHRQHHAGARASSASPIVNPGFPDPYSRGSVSPQSAPSTTVAPDEVHTPVTRQAQHRREARAVRAAWRSRSTSSTSRGRNLYNAPDVNAPDPITGLRPDPAFLRIIEYQIDGQLLVQRDAARPRARAADAAARSASPTRCRSRLATSRTSASRRRTTTTAPPRRGRPATTAGTSSWPTWSTRCRGRCRSACSRRRARRLPFNVTTGVDNNRDTNDQRPARPRRTRTATRALASTYNANFTGRVGNLPRNFGARRRLLRSAPAGVEDDRPVRARLDRVELFVEALNLTNHVNLGTPQGNIRSAAFGQSTAVNGDSSPRRMELGFRARLLNVLLSAPLSRESGARPLRMLRLV